VKVHSVGAEDNELRLMLQAAVVVRYANRHLDRYKKEKDFFVVVVYITEEGNAICQIVYQDKNSDQVRGGETETTYLVLTRHLRIGELQDNRRTATHRQNQTIPLAECHV
jgi:hypothetical protein